MNESKLSCQYMGLANDWVRGALTSREHGSFQNHLAGCPLCQTEERHARVVVLWEKCRTMRLEGSGLGLDG